MKSLKIITPLLFLILVPFLTSTAQNNQQSKADDENVRTIEIKGSNQMKFDVTKINATPGEQIRIVLTTVSNLPKIAMAHNVVILKSGTDIEAFANASSVARNNNFIAPELEKQIIAATPLAGGGETVEVTFTVPKKTGNYTYICSFPGHFMAGMKGTLVVKESSSTSK